MQAAQAGGRFDFPLGLYPAAQRRGGASSQPGDCRARARRAAAGEWDGWRPPVAIGSRGSQSIVGCQRWTRGSEGWAYKCDLWGGTDERWGQWPSPASGRRGNSEGGKNRRYGPCGAGWPQVEAASGRGFVEPGALGILSLMLWRPGIFFLGGGDGEDSCEWRFLLGDGKAGADVSLAPAAISLTGPRGTLGWTKREPGIPLGHPQGRNSSYQWTGMMSLLLG